MYHIHIGIISLLSICWQVNVPTEANATEDPKSPDNPQDPVFRVVNGKPATIGQFPYQVALRLPTRGTRGIYRTFCGGAILRVRKILTAAHCLCDDQRNICARMCGTRCIKKSLSNIYAVAGTLLTDEQYPLTVEADRTAQWRKLKRTYIPKGYSFPNRDIAIAITKVPFVFNYYVGRLPYAIRDMEYGRRQCIATGYGRLSAMARSATLQWAELDLVPRRQCNRLHKTQMKQFICTGSVMTDVLQGDSGGPLVCKNTGDRADIRGRGVIVGVVSGSRSGAGTFFTRVSSFRKFIESKANTEPHGSWLVFISVLIRSWCTLDLQYLSQI